MLLEFIQALLVFSVKSTIAWLWAIIQFFLPTSVIGKDVKGQTALITGAGGGIGSLLAKRFAKLGCNLVLWDLDSGMNDATAEECRKLGVNVKTYKVDLSNRESIYAMADKVENEVGPIHIIVNNAGIVTGRNAVDAPDHMMELTMKVNAMAHFWMDKAFLKYMLKRNEGHIVTVASACGLLGVAGLSDYCSSKHAAVGFEECLRLELNRIPGNQIKTTIVCPYLVRTPMFTGTKSKYPFLMDSLTPEYVADKTVDAMLRNQEILCLPRQIYTFAALKAMMPTSVIRLLNDFSGVTEFMDTFVGRQKQQ